MSVETSSSDGSASMYHLNPSKVEEWRQRGLAADMRGEAVVRPRGIDEIRQLPGMLALEAALGPRPDEPAPTE